jgi:hypothetical protein
MDELGSWRNNSLSHRLEPEVESMIMIIEDGDMLVCWFAGLVFDSDKIFESFT